MLSCYKDHSKSTDSGPVNQEKRWKSTRKLSRNNLHIQMNIYNRSMLSNLNLFFVISFTTAKRIAVAT